MKKALLFASVALLICSCQTYQYVTLTSKLPKSKDGAMVIDNDTILVRYEFAGYNCPVRIAIYNKLSIPVYVDWSRSAIIVGDRVISQVPQGTINASMVGTQINSGALISPGFYEISGTVNRPQNLGFIPPRSLLNSETVRLRSGFFEVPEDQLTRGAVPGTLVKFRQKPYATNQESPLKFRSYLTLSTSSDFAKPMVFDNEFWVSHIFRSDTSPAEIPLTPSQDRFYLSRLSAFGFFVGIIGAAIIVLGASAD